MNLEKDMIKYLQVNINLKKFIQVKIYQNLMKNS